MYVYCKREFEKHFRTVTYNLESIFNSNNDNDNDNNNNNNNNKNNNNITVISNNNYSVLNAFCKASMRLQ